MFNFPKPPFLTPTSGDKNPKGKDRQTPTGTTRPKPEPKSEPKKG